MKPMIDCDQVARQMWDFLDGELSSERLAELDAHIKMCGHCGSHLAFEQSFKAALHAARSQQVASSALGERVRAALRQDGFVDPR